MVFSDNQCIVQDKPIHYTYWIIHCTNDGIMYYHSVRTERKAGVDIRDINAYHSSSNVVQALYKNSPDRFVKRVERIFENRVEADQHEIRVHQMLDVKNHPKFYNLKNSCNNFTGSINEGHVSCWCGDKAIYLKHDVYIKLLNDKTSGIKPLNKGTSTFVDENGDVIRTTVEDAKKRGLKGNSIGRVNYINLQTNYITSFTKNEAEKLDKSVWDKASHWIFQYRLADKDPIRRDPPIVVRKDDPRVLSGELVPYCKDYVTVLDTTTNKKFSMHKSLIDGVRYVELNKVNLNQRAKLYYDINGTVHKLNPAKEKIDSTKYILKDALKIILKTDEGVEYTDLWELYKTNQISRADPRPHVLYDMKEQKYILTNTLDLRRLQFDRYQNITCSQLPPKIPYKCICRINGEWIMAEEYQDNSVIELKLTKRNTQYCVDRNTHNTVSFKNILNHLKQYE